MSQLPDLPKARPPRHSNEHRIAAVTYVGYREWDAALGLYVYPNAPLECSCGWAGIAAGWTEHRRAVGAISAGKGWVAQPL